MFAISRATSSPSSMPSKDNKTEADIFKQECEKWKGEAKPGAGEMRDLAIKRINLCLEEPLKNPELCLIDLKLLSLPPLPPCEDLYIGEELLEPLLNLAVECDSPDNITEHFVKNFLFHHFDELFHEVHEEDHNDYIWKEVYQPHQLWRTGNDWSDFHDEVIEYFGPQKSEIHDDAQEYFTENLKKFHEDEGLDVAELKSKLEFFIKEKFEEFCHHYASQYRTRYTSDSDD